MTWIDRFGVILLGVSLLAMNLIQDYRIKQLEQQIQQITFSDSHSEMDIKEITDDKN